MNLKDKWWCVRTECKHFSIHSRCKHKSAVNSKKCNTPSIGLDLVEMEMCPVLYDMYLSE